MKIFLAGATGALGSKLVPQLVARGHEVVGMTRSASKQDLVRSLGARPVVADALDPDAVAQAVASAEPEVIVHQLTALSGPMSVRDARHPDRSAAARMTNRLRTEATDHLLAAGRAVGARRVRGAELRGVPVRPHGRAGPDRGRPPRSQPAGALRAVQEGYHYLERAVTAIEWGEGLALRYGGFYGPGTSTQPGTGCGDGGSGPQAPTPDRRQRRRRLVASCTSKTRRRRRVVAIERGEPGVYNIVDDEPVPMREWLPVVASALDAKPPRRIPRWLGRMVAGEMATVMMTEVRGASNAKAKRELGWQPRYAELAAGPRAGTGLSDDRGSEFDELRPSAFAVAYRMLGSVSEAEDIVQEAFLRLHRAREGGERIESPRAYLSTVVSRLALDYLRSARVAA